MRSGTAQIRWRGRQNEPARVSQSIPAEPLSPAPLLHSPPTLESPCWCRAGGSASCRHPAGGPAPRHEDERRFLLKQSGCSFQNTERSTSIQGGRSFMVCVWDRDQTRVRQEVQITAVGSGVGSGVSLWRNNNPFILDESHQFDVVTWWFYLHPVCCQNGSSSLIKLKCF